MASCKSPMLAAHKILGQKGVASTNPTTYIAGKLFNYVGVILNFATGE